MQCDYLLPGPTPHLNPDYEMRECLLGKGHEGPHLILLPEDDFRARQYVIWSPANCDCEEHCEHFVYGYITPTQAITLIEGSVTDLSMYETALKFNS